MCVIDYVCGGELFTHLHQRGRFTEHEGMFYIGEITLALECLHSVSKFNTHHNINSSVRVKSHLKEVVLN